MKSLTKTESNILTAASEIVIKDSGDLTKAAELLSRLNIALDKVVAYREKKTKPLNQALKVIRAETKPIEEKLETVIDELRGKVTEYQTKTVEEAKAKQQELADKVASGEATIEQAVEVFEAGPAEKVEAESGSLSFVPHICFKITNMDAVPLDYMMPDEKKIRKAVEEGKIIPGVLVWTEQRPRNYRG